MTNKLIMPKGDGQINPCVKSLKIYNGARDHWVSNEEFKMKIAEALDLPIDSDGPFLIKKSEIARYFGLIENNFNKREARITERGVRFYDAYLNNKKDLTIDIIMESIKNDTFGRNNSASESSDSDIDPPKLLLRAAYDLPELSKDEAAYILYSMHDKNDSYKNTIDKILDNRRNDWVTGIPTELYNKYTDLKFKVFFQNIGILEDNSRFAEISDYMYERYSQDIQTISVYNADPATIFGMEKIEDSNIENEIIQKIPIYDNKKVSEKNNRAPFLNDLQRKNNRYSTDYRLSKTALANASFLCEIDNTHKTFKTKYKIDYAEAHHLIPMKEQKNYLNINIDRTENIICLCPTCHKAIHYAEVSYRNEKIIKMFNKRKELLKSVGINFDDDVLIRMYN
jgi:hypothetical protein